jgi:Flp pilus assembly protein TadG
MIARLLRWLRFRPLATDRRGAVGLFVGLTMPVLIASIGIGIEVANWATVKVELQRTADAASLTGAYYYQANSVQTNVAQNAAKSAAYIAQINGVTGVSGGTANMTWTPSTSTLADNQVTVKILDSTGCVPGTTCTIGVQTTVSRTVSLPLGSIFTAETAITLSATSIAEVIPGATGGPACMLALQGNINGVTTTQDIQLNGHVTVDAGSCALRSDGSVTVSGNVTINAEAIYSAGTYTKTGSGTVSATVYTNSGQVADPLLGNTALQNALTAAKNIPSTTGSISCGSSGCTGPTGCCTANTPSNGVTTINPGSYGGLSANAQASVSMSDGLFSFRDDVTINGSAQITATNMSIVTGGTSGSTFNGSALATLTAATTAAATNGAIPGIAFATSSTHTTTISGTSGTNFAGLVYQPNGSVTISGNATDGTAGCGEVIANDITLSGNANTTVAPNCSAYGLPTINSLPATSRVSLVE